MTFSAVVTYLTHFVLAKARRVYSAEWYTWEKLGLYREESHFVPSLPPQLNSVIWVQQD